MGRFCFQVLALVTLLLILNDWSVCFCRNSTSMCVEHERNALLQLRQTLSDPYGSLSSWKGEDCCRWKGVTCDRFYAHVIKLQLLPELDDYGEIVREKNLSVAGKLNSSLLNLRFLNCLDLSGIDFKRERIPAFLGSMKQLRYLNLSFGNFHGTVPQELGNLTELEVLDLRDDFGNLVVDDTQWVSHLQSLVYLDMSSVKSAPAGDLMQMIGMLPSLSHLSLSDCDLLNFHLSSIRLANSTSLVRLQYLDLSHNSLEGPIANAVFQNMTSLQHLDLSGNDFNSLIPMWFDKLTSLAHLNLESNHFHTIEGGLFSFLKSKKCLKSLCLDSNRLGGEILTSHGNSSGYIENSLESLTINDNDLGGALPNWLVHFTLLRDLQLCSNVFSGPIPRIIGALTNLGTLDLSENQLNGTIPSSLGQLSSLTWLDLSSNQFSGNIPASLGHLQALQFLNLSSNHLNGTLPDDFGKLSHLSDLYLFNNFLGGVISEIHFSNLTRLKYLDTSGNSNLTFKAEHGWIPPFQLTSIWMDSCKIGPTFPPWMQTQVEVEGISLSNASIFGALPKWLGNMTVGWLDLSHNQITGPLPNMSSQCSSLDLSHNQITGPLPNVPCECSSLDLSHNQITGPLLNMLSECSMPSLIGATSLPNQPLKSPRHERYSSYLPQNQITSSQFFELDLSHNLISGPLPTNIGGMNLKYLHLNDNHINGTLPSSLCEGGGLIDLNLGNNSLSGSIPHCWARLSRLTLSFNNLSGVIPSSIGSSCDLSSLHLNGNDLNGELPLALSNCTTLKVLDFGENNFSGSIPTWLSKSFDSLRFLRLRENSFTGSIPPQLCSLSRLQILDLAANNLTGTIPRCLGDMKGMKLNKSIVEGDPVFSVYDRDPEPLLKWDQEHVEQVVKGIDLEYTTLVLQLMVNLDLSSNKLVGPIPEELTLLSGLRGLNLSRNFLSGDIPTMIGDMKLLESLDLSNNRLSGTIPRSFSAFKSLNKLNLSHNNFTGPIPGGNQMQTLFDPSIYADNPLLCGYPLQQKCPGAEAPQSPEEDNNEEGKLEKVMFYLVIMLGFATGFWGVVGSLVYKKKWRRAYFNYADRKIDMAYVIVAVKVAKLRRRLGRA